MKIRNLKLLGAIALIATSAASLISGNNPIQASAADFNNLNFDIVGDGWTLNGDNAVSNSTLWTPQDKGNFLVYKNTPSLRKVTDSSWYYDYVVSATFKSSTDITNFNNGEEQFRGLLIYYVDLNNYLMVNAKWEKANSSARPDPNEITQYTLYGKINGEFAQTKWENDQWNSTEWREEWADNPNNNANLSKEVKMSVHVYNRGKNNENDDTDCVDITVECGSSKATKKDIFGYRSPFKYANDKNPITNDQIKVGLFSRTTNGENVTFSDFNVAQVNPIIKEEGIRPTTANVGSLITLPTYQATNGVSLSATTISVVDPDNNPVTLDGNTFVPNKLGQYSVSVTALNDEYGNEFTPIEYIIDVSGNIYDINEEGVRPTVGVRGETITLPKYSATTGSEDIPLTITITDPEGGNVSLVDNAFTPELVGTYNVNVKSNNLNYYVNPITYSIVVNKKTLVITEEGTRPTNNEIGDVITLPSYFVTDSSVNLKVEVTDPNHEKVNMVDNKFTATSEGRYHVCVSYEGDYYTINNLEYDINISKKTFKVVETGTRITAAKTGSTITLPTFKASTGSEDIPLSIIVTAPDKTIVELNNNSFVANQEGQYVVDVKSADATYPVQTIRYTITVDETGGTGGYGSQSQVVYITLTIVVSVVFAAVGGSFVIYKVVTGRKEK